MTQKNQTKQPNIQQQDGTNFQDNQDIQWKQYLFEHYHIEKVDQLVAIMIDSVKSIAYNLIRNHPAPQLDLQNISTFKSVYEYRRQLILNTFQQIHMQIKQRKSKDQNHSSYQSNPKVGQKQVAKYLIKQKSKVKDKRKNKDQSQQKLEEKISNILQNIKNFGKNINLYISSCSYKNEKISQEIIQTSNHSYEGLSTYFTTNKDPLVCKKILQQKYCRNNLIHAHKIRKQFWLLLIGIERKKKEYPLLYQTLTNYKQYHDFYTKTIHADVVRTVVDPDQKQKRETSEKMQRILIQYARRNPYVGYCQGMNFILNFIMTMQFQQQQCFWILLSIIQETVPLGYYTNMSGVAIDIKIVEEVLKITHPNISNKLKDLGVELSVFVLEWFVCLYTTVLPFYLLVIVWDLILIEGSVALLKVAIIFLQYLQKIIMQATDFSNFFKLYENLKKKMFIQQQSFIKKYNQIYIDKQILAILRQIFQKQVRNQKEQLKKNVKQNNKWKQIECNLEWPICFQQLKKQKHQDIEIDVWVLKQQGCLKFSKDYLGQKIVKKSVNIVQDDEEYHKKIVIGRIPHICQSIANQKNQKLSWEGISSIQLDDIHFTQQQSQGRSRVDSLMQVQFDENYNFSEIQSSTDFFRRATINSFVFKKIKNPSIKK